MFDENLSKNIKALAYEKSIDVERVFKALEDALATAARKYYKTREPMETVIDRVSGEMTMYVIKDIVIDENEIEDPQAQWTLEQARKIEPDAEVGGRIRLSYITKEVVDVVKDSNTQIRTYEAQKIDPEVEQGDEVHIPLTKAAEDFGRIAAQSAKQVLYQKVREAEREKVYNEFIGKAGELENGYVKRFERGDMIIDLNGKTEGIIPRSQQSRAERYSQGDRIKAVIVDVHTQPKGPQVVLSRTDPRLLIKLFEMEVPEIYDGTVVIRGAVREPGERAKIAVMSRERDVDPVGACVGMKGSRVQSIIRELRGEKIDIIPFNEDIVVYAQNSLAPAKITRVSVRPALARHRQARPQRPSGRGADRREDRHQVRGRGQGRGRRCPQRHASGSDGRGARGDERARHRRDAGRLGEYSRGGRLRRSRFRDQRLGRGSHRHRRRRRRDGPTDDRDRPQARAGRREPARRRRRRASVSGLGRRAA